MFCRGPAGRVCSGKGVAWVGEYRALARMNLTDLAASLALDEEVQGCGNEGGGCPPVRKWTSKSTLHM